MKNNSSMKNLENSDKMNNFSDIDNEIFFRGDFDNKKFANLNDIEVGNLVAYIMRNWFHYWW